MKKIADNFIFKKYSHILKPMYFPFLLLYLEILLSVSCFGGISSVGYTLVTSTAVGLMLYSLIRPIKGKINVVCTAILTALLVVLYASQMIYYKIFSSFFTLSSLTMAGEAMSYWDVVAENMKSSVIYILLFILPLVIYLIFRPNLTGKIKNAFAFLLVGIVLFALLILDLNIAGISSEQNKRLYTTGFAPTSYMQTYGYSLTLSTDIMNSVGIDFKDDVINIAPTPVSTPTPSPTPLPTTEAVVTPVPTPTPIPYEEQVLDIDFAALAENETDETIKSLHTYFANSDTQMQNEYTGMFEGKNLIMITAESFSHYAIDEEITPTLYKLYNEGFQFTNFYTPGWPVSTTDGEYVACVGLIPKSGVRSFTVSAENYLPFTMGMQSIANGYSPVLAYHNHTYDYYSRDLSHPNMGYDYKGLGSGLDVEPLWPESDLEMMQITTSEYINAESDTPFHAYYMTVSGHQLYNFIGNNMAMKNEEATADLPYSEPVRAYYATHIELDKALEHIINELTTAGIEDETVIVLSSDHYPYGLTVDELSEMNGAPVEPTLGIYENALLIWSGSMEEPIVVDKYAESLDIIPTISNLMGFEYDSRLLMGEDILGDDYEELVIFSDRSFKTDLGTYTYSNDTFVPYDESTVISDDYVQAYKDIIDAKFQVSELMLETDYYNIILGNDETE